VASPIAILAVDDDPNMHRLIQLYLSARVFSVTTASTGRIALHKLHTHKYDLLISDIQMPQMDGWALVKEIRSRGCDIPIIIISAFGTDEQADQIMAAGANMVLEKPFEQEQLIETIEKLLNGKT